VHVRFGQVFVSQSSFVGGSFLWVCQFTENQQYSMNGLRTLQFITWFSTNYTGISETNFDQEDFALK
jgi:hypothetical protein